MRSRLLLLVPLAAGLAGCGSEPPPQRALAPVRLTVDAPLDAAVVDEGAIEIRGQVWPPDAEVLVAGDEAGVDEGTFAALVTLSGGANVVDVTAAAPRRPAAMTAVRVTYRVPVEVPDLTGLAPEEAEQRLQAAGLDAEFDSGGGLFDGILPGELGVCRSEPSAGERVKPGSVVVVRVARVC